MSYQDVKDKLYHGRRKVANNTYLTLLESWAPDTYGHSDPDEESVAMRVHGNIVARFYPDHLQLYSCGYHTLTTKSRLNLALELAGIRGSSIRLHNHQWEYLWPSYLHIAAFAIEFKEGMKISYTGEVLDQSPIEVLKC